VLDVAYKAVYRFPLAQDGLPATKPDGVLILQGSVFPLGLAVDNVGHIFVADPNGWGCNYLGVCVYAGAVAEFAAGATGPQRPMSILSLHQDGPDFLKLDGAGRLYVHYNNGQKIAIFAKGARGNDAPISIVPSYRNPPVLSSDYVIGENGALYVLTPAGPVAVYDDPLHNPLQPNRFMWPQRGLEFGFDATLALDESTNRLYIQFHSQAEFYWNKVNYGIRPPSGKLVSTDPLIFTGDCGSTTQNYVGGTVIVEKYLIVSCASNGDVLVYRTDQFGRQRDPVEAVGQNSLQSPWEIAVGP
jgi:hypothetical protein